MGTPLVTAYGADCYSLIDGASLFLVAGTYLQGRLQPEQASKEESSAFRMFLIGNLLRRRRDNARFDLALNPGPQVAGGTTKSSEEPYSHTCAGRFLLRQVASETVAIVNQPLYDEANNKLVIGNLAWEQGIHWYDVYFDGLIDEVRIYNRALSPDELGQ